VKAMEPHIDKWVLCTTIKWMGVSKHVCRNFVYHSLWIDHLKPGISNWNCSVGHIKTFKVTRGPHFDADATMAVPDFTRNSLANRISCERYHEL